MTTTIACPLCAADIAWEGPGSEDGLGPLTSELRRFCLGPDPHAGAVVLCGDCGFASVAKRVTEGDPGVDRVAQDPLWCSLDTMDDPGDVASGVGDEAVAARVRRLLAVGVGAGGAAVAWEHTAWLAAWRGDGPLACGDAWLRAAWMHDDLDDAESGRACRQRALACYEAAVELPESFRRRHDQAVVAYLVGEIARRLGDVQRARGAFEQALTWARSEVGLKSFAEVVIRQMEQPVEILEGR